MFKNIKFIGILSILAILILSSVSLVSARAESNSFLPTFRLYVRLDFDLEPLEQPIPLEQTVKVDVNVEFSNDITDFFINTRLGRLLFFKTFSKSNPEAEVSLSIQELPEGVDIVIDPATISFDISDEPQNETIQLMITPDKNALHESTSITILVESNYTGDWNLNNADNSYQISFTPAYRPEFSAEFDEVVNVTSGKETLIPINVTNNANKQSTVKINYSSINDSLAPLVNPAELSLDIGATGQITLSVTPDDSFDTEAISFDLTIYPDPMPASGEGTTLTYHIKLVNEKSDPDDSFVNEELLFFVFAAIIVVFAIFLLIWYITRRNRFYSN